jgi:hypothetical protein
MKDLCTKSYINLDEGGWKAWRDGTLIMRWNFNNEI